MNILFLLKSFEIGGLEVVTSVLANKFSDEGHNVVLWAFYEGKTSLADRLNDSVRIFYGNGFNAGKTNVRLLHKVLNENNIQVVINQWGLPFIPALTLKKASKGLNIKTIAVYHNDPLSNGRTKQVEILLEQCNNIIKRTYLRLKLSILKSITSASMRYNYSNSDKFMVLSESFITHFETFTGINPAKKLIVQTNPITLGLEHIDANLYNKQKEVIYVGRLDYNQKRVNRVIETWSLIESEYPDWKLTIVGDGSERNKLELLAQNLNLHNISFEGFQSPIQYYKRASILLLTSEYEGFPLVLPECMSFGVVPVVYGSYSAVYDIINDGQNGLVVPFSKDSFHAEKMAERISVIMTNEKLRSAMAINAIKKSCNYSIDKIYKQWLTTFNVLLS